MTERLVSLLLLVLATTVSFARETVPLEACLRDYAELVFESYTSAHSDALELREAVEAFVSQPADRRLRAARGAWLRSRVSYGRTEAFRFSEGPIDLGGESAGAAAPELRLNAWPVDEAFIDSVRGAPSSGIVNDPSVPIRPAELRERNGADDETDVTTGYHAIEFLLWGQDLDPEGPGRRGAGEFLPGDPIRERRRQYLRVVADLLVEDLALLVEAWRPGSRNYAADFIESDSRIAGARVLAGLAKFAGFELAYERLAVPLDSGDQEDEHSCFSDNTHNDLAANVDGLRDVHRSLAACLVGLDPDLDASIVAELARVRQGVRGLGRPFDRLLATPPDDRRRAEAERLVASLERLADLLKVARVRWSDVGQGSP